MAAAPPYSSGNICVSYQLLQEARTGLRVSHTLQAVIVVSEQHKKTRPQSARAILERTVEQNEIFTAVS